MRHAPESVTPITRGVLRIHRAGVNCYLLNTADGITLVDAGLPGMWRTLLRALGWLGAGPGDISAVVLTHGHFDHVGLCERLRRNHAVGAHIHDADRRLAAHPYRYEHQAPRWRYPLQHPSALPTLAAMTVAGALTVRGTPAAGDVQPGVAIDVPGQPVPVWSPGHTDGHCGFYLPGTGAIITGDALVTLDPYSGRIGPRMVARAATADAETNLLSLERLAETDAALVLPGHGEPFEEGIRAAADRARRSGIA